METRKVAGQAAQMDKTTGTGKAQNAPVTGGDSAPNLTPSPGASVAVSHQARQLADAHKKAFEIAKATPDVREERIAALKRQIEAGTYKPDPGKIADGIAREALLEYLAEGESKNRA